MDKLLVACVVVAAQGLVVLGLLAYAVQPGPQPLSRLARLEGQRACVEATVASIRPTPSGGTRFVLTDGNESLAAAARFAWNAVPGDLVRACGLVRRASGTLELLPDRPVDLRIVRAWDAHAVPLASLAKEPWTYVGQRVATHGLVRHEGTRDYLEDPLARARIRLALARDLPEGATVRIEGPVEFDPDESQVRLRAETHRAVP